MSLQVCYRIIIISSWRHFTYIQAKTAEKERFEALAQEEMDRLSNDRKQSLPLPRVKASNSGGLRTPPLTTKHDGLPRHPTPEDLRVAQGEKGSDSKGINDHFIPTFNPSLPSDNDVFTETSENPSVARTYNNEVGLDGPEHGTEPSCGSSNPSCGRGLLGQFKASTFPDETTWVERAGHGGKEVAMVPMWPAPVNGVHERPANLPNPGPANDVEPPQLAPPPPKTPSTTSSDDGGVDEGESDLFLGSETLISMKHVIIDSTSSTISADPTLALPRNNHLPAGTSGFLNLCNAQQEVFLLLDRLEDIQHTLKFNEKEPMYQRGWACALTDVQEGLLRRSKLSHVGTAEGRILRREAVNLDRLRDKAYKETPESLGMSKGSENPALVAGELRDAINRLVEEARAALQTAERLAGRAASGITPSGTAPEAAMQTVQYPVRKDHLLVSLVAE